MKTILRMSAVLFLMAPAVTFAAEERDLSLSSLLANGADRTVAADGAGQDPLATLASVAGVETFSIPCASPLAAVLVRGDAALPTGLQALAQRIATRPARGVEKTLVTRDGRYLIHYASVPPSSGLLSIDRDRNGNPDLVDRVGEALTVGRSYLVARLGYPAPGREGEMLDVYLQELGRGLEGYSVPRLGNATPFVVLDSGLSSERVMPATLHQIAHLSLLALSARAPLWWTEESASYLTLLTTGDLRAHEASLRARLQSPGRGLDSDELLLMQGGMVWPLYLAESFGDPAILRLIWEEMAAQGSEPTTATDAVLRRFGRTLPDAWREFAAWNLFTGERDDGQHYSSGRSFPTSSLSAIGSEVPQRFEPQDPIEPLGSAAFRLMFDGRRGTLDLDVSAEGGRPAADLLVFYRPWGPRPVLVPLTFDASGSARLAVPWADAREAWIVLRNDAVAPAGSSRFELRVQTDPYTPYDLAALSASPSDGSMLLEWTTASEKGLLAWNIYRSETPDGPFTRLNSVAVPAMGDSPGDTGYIYVDDYVSAGRRYYYLLEGLTSLGLPQRSHVVSGRIAANP